MLHQPIERFPTTVAEQRASGSRATGKSHFWRSSRGFGTTQSPVTRKHGGNKPSSRSFKFGNKPSSRSGR